MVGAAQAWCEAALVAFLAGGPRAPASTPATPPPAPEPPARTQAKGRAGIRFDAGASIGVLPGFGVMLGGAVGWIGRRARIELVVRGRLPRTIYATLDPQAGGRFSLWAIGPRACGVPRLKRAPIEFPLCAGAEVGEILGVGVGFEGASKTRVRWGSLLVAPSIAWSPLQRLAIFLGIEAGLAMNRADLVIEDLERLHRLGFGFVRPLLGVEVRLP